MCSAGSPTETWLRNTVIDDTYGRNAVSVPFPVSFRSKNGRFHFFPFEEDHMRVFTSRLTFYYCKYSKESSI